jgi:hypothetical protein
MSPHEQPQGFVDNFYFIISGCDDYQQNLEAVHEVTSQPEIIK